MIRILYVTRANLCLWRAHAHNILKTIELLGQSHGIEAALVSSGRQSCAFEEMMSRHGIAPPIRFLRARFLWWFLLRNRASFNVLYVRDPRLVITMMAARLFGKKVLFEIHGSYEWPFLHWLWKLAFHAAHAHIFITRILRDEYQPHEKPYAIIPCAGIDPMAFNGPSASLRRAYHLAADAFVLLYLGGSQGIYYNGGLLVDMMPHLPKTSILFLIGLKESETRELKTRAERFGIKDRVVFIARINPLEIPAHLLAADVLLNPKIKGYAGSISSKLYEYLAAGKPIVASVVDADREVLSEENTMIVEPTAEAFARAVQRLYENPEERKRLGKQAREDAKKYTWEQRKKNLEEFVKSECMRDYRLSHQSQYKTERYERDMYRAGSYDDLVWQEEKKILDRELGLLKKRVPAPRYFDFGCGTGRIIGYLENKVGKSVGVDIAREMLAIAKEKLRRSRLIEADLTTNDILCGETFDLITAFRILLNAEPPLREAIVKTLAPKLSQDGILIFNIHGNTWSFRLPMVWRYYLRGRRLNHLSYRRVRKMLTRYGLRIERLYGFGIIPKPFYCLCPRISFAFDRFIACIPFIKYISYNLIFVCKRA